MKKTLITLLACAAVMPAMAETWNITGIKASPYASQTQKADYTYYVIYSSANSAEALTTTLSNMTFDVFTTSSDLIFSAVNGTTANNVGASTVSWQASIAKPIDSQLDTTSYSFDNIYGVSVYQGNSFSVAGAVRVPSTNKISFDSVGTSYTDFASATTPEPATATLSLLALAGLASRRRRH